MSHKLKGLGLALVAVLALGAVVASSASATSATFTADQGATITGAQVEGTITGKVLKGHEFTTKAGTVKCATATFHGTAAAAESAEQTLTPTYAGCTLGGVIPVHVAMNGCHYLFTGGETVNPLDPNTVTATVHIICNPAGNKISVTATGSTCQITIGAQTDTGIELHNRGTTHTMHVEATIDVHSIAYETHGVCPNNPAATTPFTDGTYRGVVTLHTDKTNGITVH